MRYYPIVEMMKRIWIILCLALLLLVGCGDEQVPPEVVETTVPPETEAPAPTSYTLIENGVCQFAVVRSEKADKTTIDLTQNIFKALSKHAAGTVTLTTDWIKPGTAYDPNTLEILVGLTGHPEAAQALEQVGYNQYGLIPVGNKLCVVGMSPESLQAASQMLVNVIGNQAVKGEDGTNLTIDSLYLAAKNMKGCDFTLPVFEGAEFAGTYDCHDGVYKMFFRDVDAGEFTAYLEVLAANGATESARRVLGGNTFVDSTWDRWDMSVSFYPSIGEVGIALIPQRLEEPPVIAKENYTPVEPLLTQLAQPNLEGDGEMGYLIRLEDSSFIVVDGGYNEKGADEVSKLYALMKEQNTRADGKLIVRAWFVTHAHNDHYNVLREFCSVYAGRVKVESLLFNPMAPMYQAMTETPGGWDVREAASKFSDCAYVKIMAGQVLEYPGCTFEVLYSSDDVYMLESYASYNDCSAVARLHIGGQSFLVLGDVQSKAAPRIADAWGEYLKSDIMQMAHHGNNGGSIKLYDLIQPRVILWPSSASAYGRWSGSIGMNKTLLAREYVEEVFNSGAGATTLPLPYTPKK